MKTIIDELRSEENAEKEFVYVGSIFGVLDESSEPWIQSGDSFADDLAINFNIPSENDLLGATEEELSNITDWFLDEHPAYTGKKGWYWQSNGIWYTAPLCDEEVFHVVGE